MTPETMITSIIIAIFGSTGFWAVISEVIRRRNAKKSAQSLMLKGLGHDRILFLGETYINRGWITKEEYENLNGYLYEPYKKLGGNGTAEKVMEEVKELPIKKAGDINE